MIKHYDEVLKHLSVELIIKVENDSIYQNILDLVNAH